MWGACSSCTDLGRTCIRPWAQWWLGQRQKLWFGSCIPESLKITMVNRKYCIYIYIIHILYLYIYIWFMILHYVVWYIVWLIHMCNAYCKFHAFSMDSVCSLPLMSICTPNILYPPDVPPYGNSSLQRCWTPRSIQPTTAARSSMGDDPIAATPLTGWARTYWDVMMSCHESPRRL